MMEFVAPKTHAQIIQKMLTSMKPHVAVDLNWLLDIPKMPLSKQGQQNQHPGIGVLTTLTILLLL